jgi:hypothetical protein
MNLNRITHPLRLAKGSHQPGSGKGCAMNAISYINGDAQITDFPACSARPLAALVQSCNDLLAGPDGYLSPDNSLLALELGWQTVGTADVADSVIHAWVAELLTNSTWGVLRYANIGAIKAIIDIAQLHGSVASGHTPPVAAWDAADRAARAAAPRHQPDLKPGRSVCRAGRIRIDRNRGHPPPSGARRRYRQRLARPHIGIRGQQEKPHRGAHPPRHPLLA